MNFNVMRNAFTLSACHLHVSFKKDVYSNACRFLTLEKYVVVLADVTIHYTIL